MTLGDIIKDYRKSHDLSMDAFSDKSGISKAYISLLEKNKHPKTGKTIAPSIQSIKQAADGMGMDFNMLFGMIDGDVTLKETAEISAEKKKGIILKVLGSVAAGTPISAIEDIIDEEEVTEDMARQGNLFGLRIKGQSMEPNICDGDTVIVKEQPDAENGETVVILINGDEATCKKLYKYEDGSIRLVPNNPAYSPRLYTLEEISTLPVTIVGKVIELRRKF